MGGDKGKAPFCIVTKKLKLFEVPPSVAAPSETTGSLVALAGEEGLEKGKWVLTASDSI